MQVQWVVQKFRASRNRSRGRRAVTLIHSQPGLLARLSYSWFGVFSGGPKPPPPSGSMILARKWQRLFQSVHDHGKGPELAAIMAAGRAGSSMITARTGHRA
jgi:hypothetical protein